MATAAVRVNLVDECHGAVAELATARRKFIAGQIGSEHVKAHVGLINATSRIIGTTINAERWCRDKQTKPKS